MQDILERLSERSNSSRSSKSSMDTTKTEWIEILPKEGSPKSEKQKEDSSLFSKVMSMKNYFKK